MSKRDKYTPTEKELAQAKAYLKGRNDAEVSMGSDVDVILQKAAWEIIQAAYSFNTPPTEFKFSHNKSLEAQVDMIIDDMVVDLIEDMEAVATYPEDEHADEILLWVNRERNGMTVGDRVRDYAWKFKREMEIVIAAAMFVGLNRKDASSTIERNMKHPYESPHVKSALKGGAVLGIPNYGRGHTNSMLTALKNLLVFAVGEGWMRRHWLEAEIAGAIGFVTFRNSSVPCDICDDYAGYVHPMDDPIPPLHLHCVCGMVFVGR